MTADALQSSIVCLSAETPVEAVADVHGRLDAYIRRGRELKALYEAALLARIQETGKDVVIGDVRYYAGHPSETKCQDAAGTLAALFEACGGDFGHVAECLSANGWKPGACRAVLPADRFDALFVTTTRPKLESGKPKRQLLSVNERFVRERKERPDTHSHDTTHTHDDSDETSLTRTERTTP